MRIPPARVLAALGTVCISFTAVFVALADVTPITAAFFRAAYALPVLAIPAWLARGGDHRTRRQRLGALGAGALLAVDLFFFHISIAGIGAGLATVAANTQVVFVGLLTWLIYHQLPTRRTVVFGAVIFAGVVLLSGLGRADAFGEDPVAGAVFGLIAGVTYASFLIALQAANPGGKAATARVLFDATLGTLLGSAVIGLFSGNLDLVPAWPSHGWLFAMAMLAQVAGWAFLTYALPRLPALTVSVIVLGQPMLAVLWGWLLLDERLSPIQGAGVVLVLVGLVAVNLQQRLVTTHDEVAAAPP